MIFLTVFVWPALINANCTWNNNNTWLGNVTNSPEQYYLNTPVTPQKEPQ